MKICLEKSTSTLYTRIACELARGFQIWGHECIFTEPSFCDSSETHLETINCCDYVVISHISGFLSQRKEDRYFYELVSCKLIFVHHDALSYSTTYSLTEIVDKLDSFIRTRNRSIHFSIENRDVNDLNRLGVTCYPIPHINTLGTVFHPYTTEYAREIAFVGHVLPSDCIELPINFGVPDNQIFYNSYQKRLINLTHSVKDDFWQTADAKSEEIYSSTLLGLRILFIMRASLYSLVQRGTVIESISSKDIHIFGGDPAWTSGQTQTRIIQGDRFSYHPPMYSNQNVAEIYSSSKINLNVTSMQFDSAIVNRVMDCIGAGGFILTDFKDDLANLTSCANEISYSTLDELSSKIDYFLDDRNKSQLEQIRMQIYEDFSKSCSIEKVVGIILEKATLHSADNQIPSENTYKFRESLHFDNAINVDYCTNNEKAGQTKDGFMKHVIIEGWRGINHSIAMVNQYQLIELLKLENLSIYHRDLPYLSTSWNETDNDSGLPPTVKEQIKSIPAPEWGWYDCVYCTQSRHNKPRPLADRVLTYLITEFGLDISINKESYIENICQGNNLVVASSNWVIAKLVEFGFPADKIRYVPHGVSPQVFYPPALEERSVLRSQLNASDDHFVFLNVGAMTWNKGIDLLIRAFAEVRKVHSKARLVLKDNCQLYGFGVDDVVKKVCADFPQLMTDEVRSSIVLIKSTLSLPQLRLLYGSADAYVSPYRAEGFNLPVIESIACGTPVIVSKGGPTDDFCDDDTALFITCDQVENRSRNINRDGIHLEPHMEQLVHQMESALTAGSRHKKTFAEGRSRMLGNFSWEVCTNKLASLF